MMASLKRCLLPLAAFFLLFFIPTVAEVVNSISECDQFLLESAPPQVPGILNGGNILDQNRYKPICQTYKNEKRFLTLYDIKNKIPVFSAYKYRGEQAKGRPQTPWKIEPELEDKNTNNMRDDRYINQADNHNYKNDRGYNRGHLFPTCHAFDRNEKISTFTLTNIVPQAVTFNNGSWQKMETCIKCIMDTYCTNNGVTEGFVVTGAQPGNNLLNRKVNIPSILWSAFCCYSHNKDRWLASAHWGDNIAEESISQYLQTKTLAELHQKLSTLNSTFEVFPRTQCPLQTTVVEFYPEVNAAKDCRCPAPTTTAPPTTTTGIPSTTTTTTATTTTQTSTPTVPTPPESQTEGPFRDWVKAPMYSDTYYYPYYFYYRNKKYGRKHVSQ